MGEEIYYDAEKKRWCRPLYTREQIIDIMKNLAKKHGRTPTTKEIGEWTYRSAVKQFGSLEKARDAAGLKQIVRMKKEYSKEEVLNRLKKEAEELGHPPSRREIDYVLYDSALIHFGGLEKARRSANLEPMRYPPYELNGDVEVKDGKLVLTVPIGTPRESPKMFMIYATKGFEEKKINGQKIRIMMQIGWSSEKDKVFSMETARKRYNKLLGIIEAKKEKIKIEDKNQVRLF